MQKTIKKCHSQQQLKKNATLFYNAFAQAKNVIEKQIKLGNRIRQKNEDLKYLTEKVKLQKDNLSNSGKHFIKLKLISVNP